MVHSVRSPQSASLDGDDRLSFGERRTRTNSVQRCIAVYVFGVSVAETMRETEANLLFSHFVLQFMVAEMSSTSIDMFMSLHALVAQYPKHDVLARACTTPT